jgi:hypothetical protein
MENTFSSRNAQYPPLPELGEQQAYQISEDACLPWIEICSPAFRALFFGGKRFEA